MLGTWVSRVVTQVWPEASQINLGKNAEDAAELAQNYSWMLHLFFFFSSSYFNHSLQLIFEKIENLNFKRIKRSIDYGVVIIVLVTLVISQLMG